MGLIIGLIIGFELGVRLGRTVGPVRLTIVYGSEKKQWVEEIVPIFMAEWNSTHGTVLVVEAVPMGSRSSLNQIIMGQIKPVVWSPASSIWLPLINYEWEQRYPEYVEEHGPLVSSWRAFIYSPLVIATWESFTHMNGIEGIEGLHRLSTQGALKFAHTDPRLSNSGAMAVLLEVSAACKKPPSTLTISDLREVSVRKWLVELERGAVHYGSSTGFLIEQMILSGPARLNAAFVYENLVIEANLEGEAEARWGQGLVAVYPREGTLLSDHPFCILNAPWVSSEEREVAEEFLDFLARADIQQRAMRLGFRPMNPDVELDLSIFSPQNGVKAEIASPILESRVDGEVIRKLADLWLACKARG